jgi:hypothetical protein
VPDEVRGAAERLVSEQGGADGHHRPPEPSGRDGPRQMMPPSSVLVNRDECST